MDVDDRQGHWRNVYETKASTDVSWFQPVPKPSLAMIHKTGLRPGAEVVDVGGGASSLVDHLVGDGFKVTVLDIAESALEVSKARLGAQAQHVNWTVADVTAWRPTTAFDLWHDRAVFHFLTAPEKRRDYIETAAAAVRPGGWLILATFAPDGPEKCSGLDVRRWSPPELAAEFSDHFERVDEDREVHQTPWGSNQAFTWVLLRRRA